MGPLFALVSLALSGAAGAYAEPAPGERLVLLDRKARAVVAIAAASGERLKSLTLATEPDDLLAAPGGKRLVVLNRTPDREGGASLLVLDAQSLEILAKLDAGMGVPGGRVEYGALGSISTVWRWGASGTFMSPDGRWLMVLSPGIVDDDPSKAKPGELIKVDLQAGKIAARLALDQPLTGYRRVLGAAMGRERTTLLSSADGATLAVFQRREKRHPSRVHLIDAAGPTLLATVPFDADPSDAGISWDGKEVFVWEHDKPKDSDRRRLHVVSVADRAVTRTLDVAGPPDVVLPSLHALPKEGVEPWFPTNSSVLAVPPERPPAVRLSLDGSKLFLAADDRIAIVDRARNQLSSQVGFQGDLRGLGLAPDGQAMFVEVMTALGLTNASLSVGVVRSTSNGKWSHVGMHALEPPLRFQNPDGSEVYITQAPHDPDWKTPNGAEWLASIPRLHFAQGQPIAPGRVAVVRGYGWRGKSAQRMLAFVPDAWKLEDKTGKRSVTGERDAENFTVSLKEKRDPGTPAGFVLRQLAFNLGVIARLEMLVLDVETRAQWPEHEDKQGAKAFADAGYYISLGRSPTGASAAVVAEKAVVVMDTATWRPRYRVAGIEGPVRAVFLAE